MERTKEFFQSLIRELAKLPQEVEWVEFKCNNKDPERIAMYISGISNAAALWGKPAGYLVWGIENEKHRIVGTNFIYRSAKKGNEELESWLNRMINPKIDFRFYDVEMEIGEDKQSGHVTIIEIPCAESEPTKFGKTAYIRIGSNLKPLVDFKDKEAALWRTFDKVPPEKKIAYQNATEEDIFNLLDYLGYYEKLELSLPRRRDKIMRDLEDEKFITKSPAGSWNITNYGALMIAKNLKEYEGLMRRSIRVIRYKDKTRINGIGEREFTGGYATSFERIIEYIMTVIPQEEVMEGGIRKQIFSYPEDAIRELLANIMVHQALDQKGTNPMVEIFSDRIEFSNPGAPLVAIERIVDTVPLSRNESIAGFMHRCGICEERGSGYDKIIAATSRNALIAPKIENQNNQFTKVVLFSRIPFELTSKEDRIRTCYMIACLAYVNSAAISNTDVRTAFGFTEKDKTKASRVIKDAVEAGLIHPVDPDTAPRYMKYIPFWG